MPLEHRETAGFVSENGKAGRPRKPTAEQFLAQWFEQHEPELLRVLTDALEAMRGDGAADHDVRLRAWKEAMDRVYGRPKQSQEITGAGGGPVQVEASQPDFTRLSVDELVEYRGLLARANGMAPGDGLG